MIGLLLFFIITMFNVSFRQANAGRRNKAAIMAITAKN
jgi:hypothetical protein